MFMRWASGVFGIGVSWTGIGLGGWVGGGLFGEVSRASAEAGTAVRPYMYLLLDIFGL